ncbi:Mlp family lipoprotein [Borrelia hispanica]|uniref:Mlp family lipoprotein n=1 Tax=Borrelia hispanica TaxID=40835 RepID=UPI000463D7B3|nr:Mlp family lipoprotein [Borrelia hispanica]
MYKYLKHILIYSLILVYSCTDKLKVHERISLTPAKQIPTKQTPTKQTPQTEENKSFNTIIHGFNKHTEEEREKTNKHDSGKTQVANIDYYRNRITNYNTFISWIKDKPEKKKELDKAWTEAYNWLEKRRAENAPEKTLNEYISDAIDCGNNLSCQDTKKQYGTKENQIVPFFELILRHIFISYSDPEKIFIQLHTINISRIKDDF